MQRSFLNFLCGGIKEQGKALPNIRTLNILPGRRSQKDAAPSCLPVRRMMRSKSSAMKPFKFDVEPTHTLFYVQWCLLQRTRTYPSKSLSKVSSRRHAGNRYEYSISNGKRPGKAAQLIKLRIKFIKNCS